MRRTLALTGLALAATALLAGCGSGGTTITVATPIPAPAASTTTTAPTTPAVAPDPTKAADFVLVGQTAEGDKVRVEGRFGPVQTPAESNADQQALGECAQADGRELVVRLDLTTTLESDLAGKVTVKGLYSFNNTQNITEFLLDYPSGATCNPGQLPASEVELGSLQPHTPQSFTLWAILGKAITPNHPHPSAKELGQGWGMDIPTISVNGTPATKGVAVGGPRVLECRKQYVGEDSFISITGTLPQTAPAYNPEEQIPCKGVPVP